MAFLDDSPIKFQRKQQYTVPFSNPDYSPSSPYAATPISLDRYLSYYVHRSIVPHIEDRLFILQEPEYVSRPDALAMDLYADQRLWWVFGVRNEWQDPVFDMRIGKIFVIPSLQHVMEAIQ